MYFPPNLNSKEFVRSRAQAAKKNNLQKKIKILFIEKSIRILLDLFDRLGSFIHSFNFIH